MARQHARSETNTSQRSSSVHPSMRIRYQYMCCLIRLSENIAVHMHAPAATTAVMIVVAVIVPWLAVSKNSIHCRNRLDGVHAVWAPSPGLQCDCAMNGVRVHVIYTPRTPHTTTHTNKHTLSQTTQRGPKGPQQLHAQLVRLTPCMTRAYTYAVKGAASKSIVQPVW